MALVCQIVHKKNSQKLMHPDCQKIFIRKPDGFEEGQVSVPLELLTKCAKLTPHDLVFFCELVNQGGREAGAERRGGRGRKQGKKIDSRFDSRNLTEPTRWNL